MSDPNEPKTLDEFIDKKFKTQFSGLGFWCDSGDIEFLIRETAQFVVERIVPEKYSDFTKDEEWRRGWNSAVEWMNQNARKAGIVKGE